MLASLAHTKHSAQFGSFRKYKGVFGARVFGARDLCVSKSNWLGPVKGITCTPFLGVDSRRKLSLAMQTQTHLSYIKYTAPAVPAPEDDTWIMRPPAAALTHWKGAFSTTPHDLNKNKKNQIKLMKIFEIKCCSICYLAAYKWWEIHCKLILIYYKLRLIINLRSGSAAF